MCTCAEMVRTNLMLLVVDAGFWTQAWATGKDPIQNLNDHLADPWGQNSKWPMPGLRI